MPDIDERVIGTSFTTSKSGVTGVIVEVAPHGNPTFRRVRLLLSDLSERWTSATVYDLHAALTEER